MKYKYKRKDGTLLAESDSEIKFNLALFPIFDGIEPEVEGNTKTKKSTFYGKNNEEE